jgi:sortase A
MLASKNYSRLVIKAQQLNVRNIVINLILFIGILLFGKGFYVNVKAQLAQTLIEYSWHSRNADSPASKPWWWADTSAIATLEVPRLNKRLFVMRDASGESLAFGPGHLNASAPINEGGHVMIAGHRDSHFTFLQHIRTGDLISTTSANNVTTQYRVTQAYVLNTNKHSLIKYQHNELTLITCYPFNGIINGGPLRYIVNAEPVLRMPLTSQTIQPHQPNHYSKMLENKAQLHGPELAIVDI